jgi:TonB family protein
VRLRGVIIMTGALAVAAAGAGAQDPGASPTATATPMTPILKATPTALPTATPTVPPEDDIPNLTPPPRPTAVVPENGISTVRDVTLGPGLPDLVKGRRPMVPPLARVGGAEGDVTVRFTIDYQGAVAIEETSGPEALKAAAEASVQSWAFRRTAPRRLTAVATFAFKGNRASAQVRLTD